MYVYVLCVYVCAPDTSSMAQCVYVYMFSPDGCCDVMLLTPIPGLSNVHNPEVTAGFCVCMSMFCVSMPLTPLPGLYFNIHALRPQQGLNVHVSLLMRVVAHVIFPTTSFLQHGVSEEQTY